MSFYWITVVLLGNLQTFFYRLNYRYCKIVGMLSQNHLLFDLGLISTYEFYHPF